MPLPDLIEIIPSQQAAPAQITVPGSKSITNRALILAALANGEVTLRGALWSEDTQIMVESLQRLGFGIKVEADPDEFCNRILTIHGMGGKIPRSGTAQKPLELFVGNAGTAARFLAAFVCLGNGAYRLQGTHRMGERPQAALFEALRKLGYRIETPNDRLPATIFGAGPRRAACTVRIEESSQFASALLLCAGAGDWTVVVAGESTEEAPYIQMTQRLIESFPRTSGEFAIEPDASSASYFCAANWLLSQSAAARPLIQINAFPKSNWQIDAAFPSFLPLPAVISRNTHLGDSIMTAIVLAPFASRPVRFTDLERLRVQECERVEALRVELTKCGAKVIEEGQALTVYPAEGKLHGARIATYNDHRMAMCFATLGLRIPGVKIENPACVKKTFPNFFQKLAAGPPGGLGVQITNGATGQRLEAAELFAD